jgi:quinol monooxygenase YgiN
MEDGVVAVTARMRVKQGRQADLERVLGALAKEVREKEEGCVFYQLVRSKHDPCCYQLHERYEDDDALTAHANAEHFRNAMPSLMDCLEAPPDIALFDEI